MRCYQDWLISVNYVAIRQPSRSALLLLGLKDDEKCCSGSTHINKSTDLQQLRLFFNIVQDRDKPTQVRSLRNQQVVYITCGQEHTVCLTRNGGVFSFGSGSYGQLGHGSKSDEHLPRKIIELMGTEVTQVRSFCFGEPFKENWFCVQWL